MAAPDPGSLLPVLAGLPPIVKRDRMAHRRAAPPAPRMGST
jgi:hypothetical protein